MYSVTRLVIQYIYYAEMLQGAYFPQRAHLHYIMCILCQEYDSWTYWRHILFR